MPKLVKKPKLDGRRTNYRIERTFKGIGEIRVSSGTTDLAVYKRMLVMLDELYNNPHKWHLLRQLQLREVSAPALYALYATGSVHTVDSANSVLRLDPHMFEWLASAEMGDAAKRTYGEQFKYLVTAKSAATVRDLPDLVKKYRERCKGRKTYRSFDLCRSAVMSYVSKAFTDQQGIYAAVKQIPRFGRKYRKRKPQHMTVKDVLELQAKLSPKYREVIWSMFTCGFRVREYMGNWDVATDHILIRGTKTAGALRKVPLVEEPKRHSIHPRSFAQIMQAATDGRFQPYDFRRSYARLLANAGIPLYRIVEYMGHGEGLGDLLDDYHMTLHYQRGDVAGEDYAADAKLVQQFIAKQRKEYKPPSKKRFRSKAMNNALEAKRREANATAI